MNTPMPQFDPLGLPLPPPILLALSYLTLTLHFVAMQFTVGGSLLSLYAWRRHPAIARFFGTGLPLGFSYLVTFGIPPLLFLQVVYGQFFYTSSVLVGAYWISVIPLIIVGYGAAYWHRMTREAHPRFQRVLISVTVLALLMVGYIYVNNLTLAQTPDRWLAHYRANPGGGALNSGEPTVPARYALFLIPGLFTAGLALVLRSAVMRKRGSSEEATTSHRVGFAAMLLSTVLQTGAVIALMVTLPDSIRAVILSSSTLILLSIGAASLGLSALVLSWLSRTRDGMGIPVLAAHLYVGSVACLVVTRDLVRQIYLKPYLQLSGAPVLPQWGMFAAFVVSLVAGLVFLAVITTRVVKGIASGADVSTS